MAEPHMFNPQVIGVPNAEQQATLDSGEHLTNIWQGEMQQIPVNMRGNPVGFADALTLGLPGVRRFRMAFNTYSFNADGSFHEQMEQFLSRMWENGHQVLWVLMDGPSQESGNDDEFVKDWPNSYSAMNTLQDWLDLMPRLATRHAEAWGKLLTWLSNHPEANTCGFEAINEPASYGRAAARFPASADFFVRTYAEHVQAIFNQVSAQHPTVDFYVGGWNYSATFDAFRDTTMLNSSISVLDHFRNMAGSRLVWSIHLYPQWAPSVQTLGSLNSWLDNRFRPILNDRMLFTEFNLQNAQVNDWRLGSANVRSTFMLGRNGEWFHRRGAGIAWWPVVNYAAGYMFFISGGGAIRQRMQNGYGAGLAMFAQGNPPEVFEAWPVSGYVQNVVVPLDENPWITSSDWRDPGVSPAASAFAYAFGGAGIAVLTGTPNAHNFLIGGNGRNILRGANLDDQLFTGLGGGVVRTGPGNNVVTVNGGSSRVYAGPGYNLVSLLRGATELVLDPAGHHIVFGFSISKGDKVSFRGAFANMLSLRNASITRSAGSDIASEVNLVITLPAGGSVTFQNGGAMVDSLHRAVLDFTDGWYATGWSEPVDFTEAQFSNPIVPPQDAEPTGASRVFRRDGTPVAVRTRFGDALPIMSRDYVIFSSNPVAPVDQVTDTVMWADGGGSVQWTTEDNQPLTWTQ